VGHPSTIGPANPKSICRCDDVVVSLHLQLRGFRYDRLLYRSRFFQVRSARRFRPMTSTTGGRPKAYGFDRMATRLLSRPVIILRLILNSTSYHQSLARRASFQRSCSSRKLTQLHARPQRAVTGDPERHFISVSVPMAIPRWPRDGIVDVYDLSPYFSYASSGKSHPSFFLTGPSFIKITFITPMVSPTAGTQLLDPIRGIPSRGFPRT